MVKLDALFRFLVSKLASNFGKSKQSAQETVLKPTQEAMKNKETMTRSPQGWIVSYKHHTPMKQLINFHFHMYFTRECICRGEFDVPVILLVLLLCAHSLRDRSTSQVPSVRIKRS